MNAYCSQGGPIFRQAKNMTRPENNPTDFSRMMISQSDKKLRVAFGGYTSAGLKPENQDAFGALAPKNHLADVKGIVACLSDGVSSSDNAQQASQMAVSQFVDDYYASPDTWTVRTAASKILSSLNSWLFHHGQQASARHNGFVTTFSGLIIKSNKVHLFHVGDSRIYRYQKGQRLECLTRDHVHVGGDRSILTRALGIDNRLEIDYKQEDVEVGDVFILTSDGVHEFVTPAEIRQALETNESLEDTAKTIVEHAIQCGSDDNVTCLLVRVEALPLASLDEVHRQLTQLVIPPVMDIGMKIDGYVVKRVIHSGTRSHLYLVQHPEHNRPYVLKAPSENFSEDVQYLEGFIREQWVGMRMNHESVMKIYPPDSGSRFLYLLAEYLDGQTLRQWMHDNPCTSLEKARDIARGIIVGLRVFQRMEMIHRDLKPENIMMCNDGSIKLIDFGTVKVAGLSEMASPVIENIPVGSVNYIAPEYLMRGEADIRSDLFSLGVIIYEMLTGKQPFNMGHAHRRLPKSTSEWRYRSLTDYRKDIPIWIDFALKKATNPSIQYRYEALSEFMVDLCEPNEKLVKGHRQSPLIERNPVLFWQCLSCLLGLVIILQWIFL